MPWYAFAAATPVLYSWAVFIDKFLIEKRIKNPIVLTSVFGMTSGLIGVLIGLIHGFQPIGLFNTLVIMAGGMLLVFYLLPYYAAIQKEDVSRVIPMYELIPVFTLGMSALFLHETLTFKQILGLFVVVIGAVTISMEHIEGSIFRPRKALWLILLSSILYGTVGIVFRYIVKDAGYWTTFSYEYIGTGIAGVALLFLPSVRRGFQKDFAALTSSLGLLAVDKACGITAQLSEGVALSLAFVPLVNTIESIQPIVMLIEGMLLTVLLPRFIRENISGGVLAHKAVSIAIIFAGLTLMYL
ncbi:EamA family transporter [Patescibacteria group bacterium]|nr:EamA family transporter [Patescibacteria group bacterium]